MVQVKFLIDKETESVFALFPELNYDNNGNFTSYSHVGQHSACSHEYANECKEAQINEYWWSLLPELISFGYNDLQIMNSQTIQCQRQPTKFELKQGYGATHYRDFPLSVIGLKKGKLIWKDWFVAPDDGLRYYTK